MNTGKNFRAAITKQTSYNKKKNHITRKKITKQYQVTKNNLNVIIFSLVSVKLGTGEVPWSRCAGTGSHIHAYRTEAVLLLTISSRAVGL